MMKSERFLNPSERGKRRFLCEQILNQINRTDRLNLGGGYRRNGDIARSVELRQFDYQSHRGHLVALRLCRMGMKSWKRS